MNRVSDKVWARNVARSHGYGCMKDLPGDLALPEDYDLARARHYGSLAIVSDVKERLHYYLDDDGYFGLDPMDPEAVY